MTIFYVYENLGKDNLKSKLRESVIENTPLISDKFNQISINSYYYGTFSKDDYFFYPIMIQNPFDLEQNFLLGINSDILKQIRTGKIHLLLDQSEEYDLFETWQYAKALEDGALFNELSNFFTYTPVGRVINSVDIAKIPHCYVHWASPLYYENLLLQELKKYNLYVHINFHFRDYFLELYSDVSKNNLNKAIYPSNKMESYDYKYLYVALNAGRQKPPKVEMIYRLWQENMIDKGKISLEKLDQNEPTCRIYNNEFLKLLPIKPSANLENKPRLFNSESVEKMFEIEHEILHNVIIYISCETLIDSNYCFITEKTYRAIIHKKAFMIVGNKNSLQKLKDLGFKTFNTWWDESYDKMPWQDQIEHIIELLKKLDDTPEQLRVRDIYSNIEEVLEYNFLVLRDTDWFGNFEKSLIKSYNT